MKQTQDYLPPEVFVHSMHMEGIVCSSVMMDLVATEEWEVVDLSML
jgi:hypothetical protein